MQANTSCTSAAALSMPVLQKFNNPTMQSHVMIMLQHLKQSRDSGGSLELGVHSLLPALGASFPMEQVQ